MPTLSTETGTELLAKESESSSAAPADPTDTELLDWLQSKLGEYTGRVICRRSGMGRGWRLHESDSDGAVTSVRQAIRDFIARETEDDVDGF